MHRDSIVMFENYLKKLEESKKTSISRPDMILSRSHTQKTTMAANPDVPEAHGSNIGRTPALSLKKSDDIRDINFKTYISEDMEEGYYIMLTGEESKIPASSQKILKIIKNENPDNKYFKYLIGNNISIPYWMIPDCIESFTITAKTEKDPLIKKSYTDSIIAMYESMSNSTTYKQIYRNCKPILRIKTAGGKRELEEVRNTYTEIIPKIINRIKLLKLNTQMGLLLRPFLFHNHTKPRQQVKFNSDQYEDAIFLHAPEEGGHNIFGKTDKEPKHSHDVFDPTYGVSTGENIRDIGSSSSRSKNLEDILAKDAEHSVPASSIGSTTKSKKKKIKKESYESFIQNILF